MQADRIRAAVIELLAAIGEDPNRPELASTPARFADAYAEFFKGIALDPLEPLSQTFAALQNEVVIVKDIQLVSICEHHLLPFTGVAHLAYLPAGRVVGLGRLARVVEILSARPQLQENLTAQIAQAIETGLGAQGVLVVIEARHQCVASRGARQPEVSAISVAARGEYAKPEARAEIMALISMGNAAVGQNASGQILK